MESPPRVSPGLQPGGPTVPAARCTAPAPCPAQSRQSTARTGREVGGCSWPPSSRLKIKPLSNRDSRGWWGQERGARAGRLPLSASSKPSSSRVRGWNPPAQSLGVQRGFGLGLPPSPRPFQPLLWRVEPPAAHPASLRGGAGATGAGLSTRGPPTPNPKGCADPAAPGQSLATRSRDASVQSQPSPRCPRRPVPHTRTPAPAPCILPYLRSGRGGGSPRETLQRRLEPQGLFQGAGENRSRRAPRGARERRPPRVAEHGGGPGAGGRAAAHLPGSGARWNRGGRALGCTRLPGCVRRWVRSVGRGPAAGLVRAAAASRARGTRLCGRLSPRGSGGGGGRACRRGAERRRGRRGAGRRRRGRGRRAAHRLAGPGAEGCAAARGLGPSPREATFASPSPCPRLKWLGGWRKEVGEPASLGARREVP